MCADVVVEASECWCREFVEMPPGMLWRILLKGLAGVRATVLGPSIWSQIWLIVGCSVWCCLFFEGFMPLIMSCTESLTKASSSMA